MNVAFRKERERAKRAFRKERERAERAIRKERERAERAFRQVGEERERWVCACALWIPKEGPLGTILVRFNSSEGGLFSGGYGTYIHTYIHTYILWRSKRNEIRSCSDIHKSARKVSDLMMVVSDYTFAEDMWVCHQYQERGGTDREREGGVGGVRAKERGRGGGKESQNYGLKQVKKYIYPELMSI